MRRAATSASASSREMPARAKSPRYGPAPPTERIHPVRSITSAALALRTSSSCCLFHRNARVFWVRSSMRAAYENPGDASFSKSAIPLLQEPGEAVAVHARQLQLRPVAQEE